MRPAGLRDYKNLLFSRLGQVAQLVEQRTENLTRAAGGKARFSSFPLDLRQKPHIGKAWKSTHSSAQTG